MENKQYMNPYLAGILLGLILLTTIFITGRGLGASGAAKSSVVAIVSTIAPDHTQSTPYFEQYLEKTKNTPLKSWLVFEVFGVLLGGFLSGLISGRLNLKTDHGPNISRNTRWIFAILGGVLFGIGTQFGRGCTSGAALSGMAVLSAGGFLTMIAIFGSGYLFAWFARKLWV